jgi:hypothetical protein
MANKEQIYAKIAEIIERVGHDSDLGGGEIVAYAVDAVKAALGIKCDYTYCGGFDSPGYRIDCYAIAFVTDEGELGLYDYQYEIY